MNQRRINHIIPGGVSEMPIDLFGEPIPQKRFTQQERLSGRQAETRQRDFYETEPKDIERFLAALDRDGISISGTIWEPAAGQGAISKTLIQHGHQVLSTDIVPYRDRHIDISELDFFTVTQQSCKTIFTNPPFNLQEDFLRHALSFNVDVIFFIRLSFLSSIKRHALFIGRPPAFVYVYSARAHCYKNGVKGSAADNMIDYCVIYWKPPHAKDTILRWIA